jgi:hypothetical protein
MTILRKTFAAACIGAALTALPAATGAAQAMPVVIHAAGPAAQIHQARWICGPYGCHWAPNYYYGWRGPYWGYRHHGWGNHWRW